MGGELVSDAPGGRQGNFSIREPYYGLPMVQGALGEVEWEGWGGSLLHYVLYRKVFYTHTQFHSATGNKNRRMNGTGSDLTSGGLPS